MHKNYINIGALSNRKNVTYKWDNVFKNGPSKIRGRQPLKNLNWHGLLNRPYHFKFFKGCLPQILLDPFLNTLSQMQLHNQRCNINKNMTEQPPYTNKIHTCAPLFNEISMTQKMKLLSLIESIYLILNWKLKFTNSNYT